MDKMDVVLYYPGGSEKKTKKLRLSQIEVMTMMMSNKVNSEDRCALIEERIFFDKGEDGIELRVMLGDCCH